MYQGVKDVRAPVIGPPAAADRWQDHQIQYWIAQLPCLVPAPMFFPANEIDVLETAQSWLASGHGVALATVVKTAGSTPRQAGSHIAVRNDGLFAGSVSAGCVEGAIIEQAQAALADGKSRRLTFGVNDDGVMSSGLLCGGEIEILVEPVL
jgi:hypothetical protein